LVKPKEKIPDTPETSAYKFRWPEDAISGLNLADFLEKERKN